jgi:hypothetical protein
MTNKHLNDTEIQQYILQKTNCDVDIIKHIQHCTNCKVKAEQYKLLFEGIKQQEKPVFNFNLADLVIKQLPGPQLTTSNDKSFFKLVVFIALFSLSMVFCFLGNNLLNLFLGMTPILIGIIITTGISLLLFLCVDMYRKYQAQMRALNFY